jgi:hypothetical protein
VANLKQFLLPMGTTFRAGTSQGAKSSRAGFVQLLNHTKENLGRAYSRLRMTHASRDYWKDATASTWALPSQRIQKPLRSRCDFQQFGNVLFARC